MCMCVGRHQSENGTRSREKRPKGEGEQEGMYRIRVTRQKEFSKGKRVENCFSQMVTRGLGEPNGQNPPLLYDPGRSRNQDAGRKDRQQRCSLYWPADGRSLHIMPISTMPAKLDLNLPPHLQSIPWERVCTQVHMQATGQSFCFVLSETGFLCVGLAILELAL